MHIQLFEGERVRLGPIDPEKDAETISQWTHEPEYLRLTSADPARPLSSGQVKKKLEAMQKEAEKRRNQFDFAIRARADDRIVGCARLHHIEWTHGAGMVQLSIGQPEDRSRGYGSEALKMVLRYAFNELNLHRLGAVVFAYNAGGLHFLERSGFVVEVRRRQAIKRGGRRWDVLVLGQLREEWMARNKQDETRAA